VLLSESFALQPEEPLVPTTVPSTHTFGHDMLAHWPLDPAILYLNHGTVGVVPRRVQAAQDAVRAEIERQPARFLVRELADVGEFVLSAPPRMRTAAAAVAGFVGARADDLAFVDNATTGCNAVMRSFDFSEGDEILITDQSYGAITNLANYVASQTGAVLRIVELPYPGTSATRVVAAIEAAITSRTRMLVVDHVVSGSSLILPIAAIAAVCRLNGVATLVYGAQAPGMIPLDLPSLGVDYYVGNLHKWALTARPLAILWVAPERRATLHPTVISWGYMLGMSSEFDMLGTRDPSAALSATAALAFMDELGVGAMREWNHRLVCGAAQQLAGHWGTEIPAPESMYGSMVTIPLPERFGTTREASGRLKDALLFEDGIEAQVLAFKGRVWVRLAAQVYNEPSDYERLRDAIDKRG
jgi:isopenicillin-N epimerase